MSPEDLAFDRALRALEAGDWEAAHLIVQEDPSELAAWAHGVVHLMEGDRDNAAYWYLRARRAFGAQVTLPEELAALRALRDDADDRS